MSKDIPGVIKTVCKEFSKASFPTFFESVAITITGNRFECSDIYKLRNGVKLAHKSKSFDRVVIRECIINNAYVKLLQSRKLGAVIDLGAHKGYFLVGLLQDCTVDKVICVEPTPDNIKTFLENKRLNPDLFSKANNVNLIPAAIDVKTGQRLMYFTDSSVNHGFIDPSNRSNVVDTKPVDTITLKKIFEDNNLQEVDLIKIDIEGAEYALFDNPEFFEYLLKCKQILMEVHVNYGDGEAIKKKLRDAGYTISFPNPKIVDVIYARKSG